MSKGLRTAFAQAKSEGRPAFIAFVTAGYPSRESYVDALLALQNGGADVIEIGVPFSDPIAEGPTIQASNLVALSQGVNSIDQCLAFLQSARAQGLTVPVVLMGYSSMFVQYGDGKADTLVRAAAEATCNGFIIVDLPPEESYEFRRACQTHQLSYIPLLTPTTTSERMSKLVSCADAFIYCVSVLGVTGERTQVSTALPAFIARVRSHTSLPIAIGFGISTREHFVTVGALGDGVVIGSAIIRSLKDVSVPSDVTRATLAYCAQVTGRTADQVKSARDTASVTDDQSSPKVSLEESDTDRAFRAQANFGEFGGRFVPETLVSALDELERSFRSAMSDSQFQADLAGFSQYIGRPTPLHLASRLTEYANGAKIWIKREDLNHTGAHKINNAIAQGLLCKRMGKTRMVAETGAGQHGVASATACAHLGLELVVFMGAVDCARQQQNVFRMELLGAKVIPVETGSRTLKDAVNEAMRYWVSNVDTTYYCLGSAVGPHPYPVMVREFQSVIGRETRAQMLTQNGALPNAVVACVGGGSNCIGMFHPFTEDAGVRLVGVEAAGCATLTHGYSGGVLHGNRSYVLQDANGQIQETHSISAGLDYPGVGPEHAHLKETGRAEYTSVTDDEAMEGFEVLTRREGIIPALESSHAVYGAIRLARTMSPEENIVICLSGRGDKDLQTVRTYYADKKQKEDAMKTE